MFTNSRNRLCAMARLVIAVTTVQAATLHVPADYATIQSCIDAAVSGQDECVVAHGCGGAVANVGGAPSISSCMFHSNTADGDVGYGGGIYNDQSSPWIRSCEFAWNTANNGGALYSQYGQAIVSECIFNANSAK